MLSMLSERDWFANIVLKHAYVHVPVPPHQTVTQFFPHRTGVSVPFGLLLAPQVHEVYCSSTFSSAGKGHVPPRIAIAKNFNFEMILIKSIFM